MTFMASWFHLFVSSLLVFFATGLCLPIQAKLLSAERRLFYALYSLTVYLMAHLLVQPMYVALPQSLSFLVAFFIVTLLTLSMAIAIRLNDHYYDFSFVFSFWYCSFFALCLAFSFYLYVALLLFFAVFVHIAWRFLIHFGFDKVKHTVLIASSNADVFERIDLLFDALKVPVLDSEVQKNDVYYLSISYRCSSLTQHVLMKHLLSREDLISVVLQ